MRTHVDLCSGIGGFSLGLEAAGFKTIAFSEIDEYASAVLRKHWPFVPNFGDIRTVPAIACSVLTCGDPCQPFSNAGLRRGEDDHRYLWPAVLGCIERCQPDWLILENVVGIKGMVLATRIDDLAKRGYQSKSFDIPSCGFGLPSVERHVWIVAARDEKRVERNREGRLPTGDSENGTARLHEWDHRGAEDGPKRWCLPTPRLLRSRKGFPNFVDRIKCIGNAVPPQIPFLVGKTIIAVENLMKTNLLLTLILTPFLAFGLPITKPIPLTFGSHGKTQEADFIVPFLIGTPLGGPMVVDFTFAPGQFARLTPGTPVDFQAFLWLQTDVSGFPGFVVGTGYLTGDLGQPLHTPQRLGASDADNGSMACGLFPLFSGELTAPVAFRGVHLDLVLPAQPGQVTDAEFRLLRGPFFVGPVPEHIHPLCALIVVTVLLITFKSLK